MNAETATCDEAIRCLRLKLGARKERVWTPGMVFSAEIGEVEMLIAEVEKLRLSLNGMIGLVQLLSRNEDIPTDIRSRMTENHRFQDAQRCFPETNWDEYGLMAPGVAAEGLSFKADGDSNVR